MAPSTIGRFIDQVQFHVQNGDSANPFSPQDQAPGTWVFNPFSAEMASAKHAAQTDLMADIHCLFSVILKRKSCRSCPSRRTILGFPGDDGGMLTFNTPTNAMITQKDAALEARDVKINKRHPRAVPRSIIVQKEEIPCWDNYATIQQRYIIIKYE